MIKPTLNVERKLYVGAWVTVALVHLMTTGPAKRLAVWPCGAWGKEEWILKEGEREGGRPRGLAGFGFAR